MNSEQAVLQKLIAAGLLQDGEHISYQNLQGNKRYLEILCHSIISIGIFKITL